MNADSLYVIGTSHTVCQDYARAHIGVDIDPYDDPPRIDYGYALVADGCSSSPDTDVGARLLTLAAEDLITRSLTNEEHLEGPILINNALAYLRSLGVRDLLEENVLDATLLAAVVKLGKIYISAHGDGIVMLRYRDGNIEAHEIIYMDNYPGYPSYHLDTERRHRYLQKCPGWSTHIHRIPPTDGPIITTLRPPLTPFTMILDAEDYDLVAVMSDGFGSFTQRGENGTEEVPTSEVLKELFKFKFFKGAFVQRRLRRFLKDAAKLGWVHDDDLSVAAIYIDG